MLLGAVLAGLAFGVAIDVLRVGGVEAWFERRGQATIPTFPPYEARGRLVDVDGNAVYLDCRGSGSPTVVLESGLGAGAETWGPLLDGIARSSRACAWDRPGVRRSSPLGPHSIADTARLLGRVLASAGERPPFVVVAHSFGGTYARAFATSLGEDVRGIVMIDTYEPDLGMVDDPLVPADVRAVIQDNLDSTAEMIVRTENLDWARTLEDLARARPIRLPGSILTVDPAGRWVDPDPARQQVLIDAWRRGIERVYPDARLEIVSGAGHYIHIDRTELVLDRVRALLDAYRTP